MVYKFINKITFYFYEFLSYIKSYFLEKKIVSLRHIIANKDILVLGSSPNPTLPVDFKNMKLIACNGSASIAKKIGLNSPVITVVDFELIDLFESKNKDVRKRVIESGDLIDLDLGVLVATQSNDAIGGHPEILGASYSTFVELFRYERRRVIDDATGQKILERNRKVSLCSTGAFAVALAIYLGAKSVTVAGFSFYVAKSNQDNLSPETLDRVRFDNKNLNLEIDTRSHSMADSLLFGLAVIRGVDLRTTEVDIYPVIQNYGRHGANW